MTLLEKLFEELMDEIKEKGLFKFVRMSALTILFTFLFWSGIQYTYMETTIFCADGVDYINVLEVRTGNYTCLLCADNLMEEDAEEFNEECSDMSVIGLRRNVEYLEPFIVTVKYWMRGE